MCSLEKFKTSSQSNWKRREVTKNSDDYYNSRPYKNRIGAWASSQSQTLDKNTFLEKIKEFEKNILMVQCTKTSALVRMESSAQRNRILG